MKTTLIKLLMDQYFKWYDPVGFLWNENLYSLSELFIKAGYIFNNCSNAGLLMKEIEIERLKNPLKDYLKNTNGHESYDLINAIILTGAIEIKEFIPLFYKILEEDRADQTDRMYIFKTFIMLGEDIANWLTWIEKDFEEDDVFIRLAITGLMKNPSQENLARAWELSKKHSNENDKIMLIPYLSLFHKKGFDTSEWTDFIISNQGFPFYNEYKIEWMRMIGTAELFNRLFDSFLEEDNESLVMTLFLRAIAEPEKWKILYPLLKERKVLWIDQEKLDNIRLKISYLTLLGIMGEDLSFYLNSDDWSIRTGAILGEITRLSAEKIEELRTEESDDDVMFALETVSILNKNDPNCYEIIQYLNRYMNKGYGLDKVSQSLIMNLHKEKTFPDIAVDFTMNHDYDFDPSNISDVADDFSLVRYGQYYMDILQVNDPGLHHFNYYKMAFSPQMSSYRLFWEHQFLTKLDDFYNAQDLLFLMGYHGILPENTAERAKADLHLKEEKIFTPREFDSIFPLFFNSNLCDKYRSKLVQASAAVLMSRPQQAYSLYNLCGFETDDHAKILQAIDSIPESKNAEITRRLLDGKDYTGDWLEYKDTYILDSNFASSYLQKALYDETLTFRQKVEYLLLCKEINNSNYRSIDLIVNKELIHLFPGPHGYFSQILEKGGWVERQQCMQLVEAEPSMDYLPGVMKSFNDNDSDVREAAIKALEALLEKEQIRQHTFLFINYSDDDEDDEEYFKTFVDNIKENVTNDEQYKDFLGRKLIVEIGKMEDILAGKKSSIDITIWRNLFLHLSVDFADEKEQRVVATVVKKESGEVLNWLLSLKKNLIYYVLYS